MLQEEEKNITTQYFACKVSLNLTGKICSWHTCFILPSLKCKTFYEEPIVNSKISSKIYISSPYITIGLFCSLFHFDFTRVLMPQSYWSVILYRSTKIYLHFVYLFLNSFLKICSERNIRDFILLMDPKVLLRKAVNNFFYTQKQNFWKMYFQFTTT